jgi:hypothetical protein
MFAGAIQSNALKEKLQGLYWSMQSAVKKPKLAGDCDTA